MRWNKVIFAVPVLACFLLFLGATMIQQKGQSFEEEKELIVMRKIGHEILLLNGNTHSRVMPVKEIEPGKYELSFEHSFAFEPDSLIKVVDRILEDAQLSEDYLVNVLDCADKNIVYGFAMIKSRNQDLLACQERPQPEQCYLVQIKLDQDSKSEGIYAYLPFIFALLSGGLFLIFGGYMVFRYFKDKPLLSKANASDAVALGQFRFLAEEQCLYFKGEQIKLTRKEAKLLDVFARLPDRIIDREVLQDEVWGNEGVIVGRSLDMFISKLRKKLSQDPKVNLVNIHGKGYKLSLG